MGGQQRALLGLVSRSIAASARSCYFNGSQNRGTLPFSVQISQAYRRPAEEGEGFTGVAQEAAEIAKNTVTASIDIAASTIDAAARTASNIASGAFGSATRSSGTNNMHRGSTPSSVHDPFADTAGSTGQATGDYPARDKVKAGVDSFADTINAASGMSGQTTGSTNTNQHRYTGASTGSDGNHPVRDSVKAGVDAAADTINAATGNTTNRQATDKGQQNNYGNTWNRGAATDSHPVRDTVKAGVDTTADTINAATGMDGDMGRKQTSGPSGQANYNHPAQDAIDPVRDVDRP